MSKFFSIVVMLILCFALCSPIAFADNISLPEDIEFSAYSDSELLAMVAACNGELYAREREEETLYDKNGVKVLLDGLEYSYYKSSDSLYFFVNIAVLNTTDEKVRIRVEDTYIDGWQDDLENRVEAAPNRNTKDNFITSLEQCGIKTVDELKKISSVEIEFRVEIGDEDDYVTVLITDFSTLKEAKD